MTSESRRMIELGEIIKAVTPPKKIQTSEFRETGDYPVIDQSPLDIAGYTNDATALIHPPKDGLIVFGDHTCVLKFERNSFAQGADGIKIFEVIKDVNPHYVYAHLKAFPLLNDGYKRHFSELKRLKIFIPESNVQDYISEIQYLIDSKISSNIVLSRTLEGIAQSIFKSWFIDFDPVKAKMAGEQPVGMDDATATLFPDSMDESELGLIPKGWKSETIKDICDSLVNGSTPLRTNSTFWDSEDIPWYKTGELSDGFLFESKESISNIALDKTSVKMLPKGGVLMAIYAAPTVGRLGILTKNSTFNQACTGMVAKDKFGIPFLYLTLYNRRVWFNSLAIGAAQQNISKVIVEGCPAITASQDVHNAFLKIVQPIFDQLESIGNQTNSLILIRDSLLPRLISGELQVPQEMLAS
jgi:type I restriction enzyme S subunit